ncbi:hypothetical protein COHA_010412 [Chlorella ohadii]|uniref:RING-CH-type domain-containing protein n=1 Tax=Chlorella ohadii TaxID=2649997 RepID=A0AAD5DFT9_9CHLO|nr:hypothetical protein COHA_010412 [Chlorella ohadii]
MGESDKECKYCLEPEDQEEGGSFVTPCSCRRPVHSRCLSRWIVDQRGQSECEICNEPWRGPMPMDVATFSASIRALDLQGEDAEAIVEAVTEEIGEFLLLRNALLERQLQETLEDLYRIQALRDQAARYNAQQYLQLREAQRELAALRAANRAVQLTPDAEALQEAEARVSRAEADRDAAKEEQLMSKKEADLAWKEKNVAQTKLNQLQHRANRLERENISLREQLHRLRRKMADAGQPALEQPAQQEGEAPPALSRAQHREQMQLRQEVRSLRQELRGSQEEASRLQARVAELEPEAAMMGDIRRQAQQGGSAAPPKQWRKWLLAAGVGAAVGFGIDVPPSSPSAVCPLFSVRSYACASTASGSAATMAHHEEESCKYCLGPVDEEEGGAFVTPCNCRNPVHERCLFQWITNRRQGRSQCEICREPWRNDALMRVRVPDLAGAMQQAQQAQQGGMVAVQRVLADTQHDMDVLGENLAAARAVADAALGEDLAAALAEENRELREQLHQQRVRADDQAERRERQEQRANEAADRERGLRRELSELQQDRDRLEREVQLRRNREARQQAQQAQQRARQTQQTQQGAAHHKRPTWGNVLAAGTAAAAGLAAGFAIGRRGKQTAQQGPAQKGAAPGQQQRQQKGGGSKDSCSPRWLP